MSTDLENITASFGLVRREFRDVHAVVRLDTQVRRLVEPAAIHRPAGLVARYAACKLIALKEKRSAEAQVAPAPRHPAAGAGGIRHPISNHRCDKPRPVAWPYRAVPSNS